MPSLYIGSRLNPKLGMPSFKRIWISLNKSWMQFRSSWRSRGRSEPFVGGLVLTLRPIASYQLSSALSEIQDLEKLLQTRNAELARAESQLTNASEEIEGQRTELKAVNVSLSQVAASNEGLQAQ